MGTSLRLFLLPTSSHRVNEQKLPRLVLNAHCLPDGEPQDVNAARVQSKNTHTRLVSKTVINELHDRQQQTH